MTLLALISRWVLGGGWKLLAGAGTALALGFMAVTVAHWKNQAARIPNLTAQIADTDKRQAAVLTKLAEAEQKRGAAEAALSAWQSFRSATLDPIKESGRNAPASTNAVCAPSASDRRLRNDAIRQLLGADAAGDAGGVSGSSATPH